LDPACLQLMFMGMTMAPATMPQVVRKLFGVDPDSEEFLEKYSETLRRVLARISAEPNTPTESE
ncbi:MAG: TetR/AcrR family transcriptional regulator, partial [Stackebrandtia sp.]